MKRSRTPDIHVAFDTALAPPSMAGGIVCIVALLSLFGAPSSAVVIPDLVQVKTTIPSPGPNEFLTGPFLEGVTEGNILYAFSRSGSTLNLSRIGPQGNLPPLPIGSFQHDPDMNTKLLGILSPRQYERAEFSVADEGVTAIYAGNGLVYPFSAHRHRISLIIVSSPDPSEIGMEHEHFDLLDGNFTGNGTILNNPGGTSCDFSRVIEGYESGTREPLLLSSNRLYIPTVVSGGIWTVGGGSQFCLTDGYVFNADFTAELTPGPEDGNAGGPEDVHFSFVRSTKGFDPVPVTMLRRNEDFAITDPATGEIWGSAFPFSNDYYMARREQSGAAIVWMGRRPGFETPLEAAGSGGPARADLEGPFMPPPTPDPERILALGGMDSTPGTAQVFQTADKFVLLSWRDGQGVEQWGSFKYAIFGNVVSPYDRTPEQMDIRARHVRDGNGFYFALDDLQYAFSLADKKSPDLIIPVEDDGTFSLTGVLVGTYELQMHIGGLPVGSPKIVSVTDYRPAVFELPAMLGIENDQAFASLGVGVGVNVSNGNLVVQSVDVENVNVGPFLGIVRTFNGLDFSQEMNALKKEEPDFEPIPLPFGRGWTHNYNLMILDEDTEYFDMSTLRKVPDTTVIFVDEDGTWHTFIRPWPIVKKTIAGREVIEYEQMRGTGADPMRLVKTESKRLELTRKDGTKFVFDILKDESRIARLTRIEDPNGNAIDLDYDADGRLVQVESPGTVRRLLFDYAVGSDAVSSITDDQGRVFLYLYESGKLVEASRPAAAPVSYAYDAENRLVGIRHDVHGIAITYDPLNRAVAIAPPDGRISLAYEPSNDIPTVKTSIIDAAGVVTAAAYQPWKKYDAAGRPLGGGRVESLTGANGAVTQLTWDPRGTPTQLIEANGHVMTLEYDDLKNLTRLSGSDPITWTYPDNLDDFDPRRSLPRQVKGVSPAPIELSYDDAGNFVEAKTADVVMSATRNADGTIASVSSPAGGVMDLEYSRGNISGIAVPASVTALTYGYKESLGLPDRTDGSDGTTLFSYDDAGRPVSIQAPAVAKGDDLADLTTTTAYDNRGNPTSITLSTGQIVSFEYSSGNRLIRSRRFVTGAGPIESSLSHDERGLLVRATPPDGVGLEWEYDNMRRITAMTRGTRNPRRLSFTYDSVGNITRMSTAAEAVRTDYDPQGRPTRYVRESSGISPLSTNLTYNHLGLSTGLTMSGDGAADPSLSFSVDYDEINRPTRVLAHSAGRQFAQDFGYDLGTDRLASVDQGEYLTRFSYDGSGRVIGLRRKNKITGLEADVRAEYDANDRVTMSGAVGGAPAVERRYNTRGWLMEEKRGHLITTFSYDNAGRRIGEKDNLGRLVSRIVNEEGWALKETVNGRSTEFSYDVMGRVTRRVDPDGSVREFSYNEHGEMVNVRTTGVSLAEGAPLRQIVDDMDYDAMGNRIAMSRNGTDTVSYRWSGGHLTGMTDPQGRIWSYGRDAFGNLASIVVDSALVAKNEYDGFGNRISMTDGAGNTTAYKHDVLGREIERADPDGTLTSNKYHGSGKVVERTTRTASGDVRTESWEWAGGELLTKISGEEGSITYERNEDGHLSGVRLSGVLNGQLTYVENPQERITHIGGLSGISLDYSYDADGRLTRIQDHAGRVTTIAYDQNGREKRRVLPNGEVIEKEYNAAGWILKQTHTLGSKVFTRLWEYDERGRVIVYLEDGKRFSYAYDNLDRLTEVNHPAGLNYRYRYDSRGNLTGILSESEEIIQTFDAADRLIRREIVTFKERKNKGHGNNEDHDDGDNPGRGKGKHGETSDDDGEDGDRDDDEIIKGKHGKRKIIEYVNDARGRAVSIRQVRKNGKVVKGTEITFTWDGVDRLIKSVKGSITVDYAYDPEGRLIRRVEKGAGRVLDDRRFVWDVTSENILAELSASGDVLARYAPTRAQDDVIVKENLTTRKTAVYSDFNLNLPTRIVRDEFGNVLESLETVDPYGAIVTPSSVDHTRFMGKMQDPVTGWFYFRHRFYDAQARRFVTKDPTPMAEGDPTRVNPYAAFGNNPVSNLDPMGLLHEIGGDPTGTPHGGYHPFAFSKPRPGEDPRLALYRKFLTVPGGIGPAEFVAEFKGTGLWDEDEPMCDVCWTHIITSGMCVRVPHFMLAPGAVITGNNVLESVYCDPEELTGIIAPGSDHCPGPEGGDDGYGAFDLALDAAGFVPIPWVAGPARGIRIGRGIRTTGDIVDLLIKQGKVNPASREFVIGQVGTALKILRRCTKESRELFKKAMRKILEEAAWRR